MEKNRISLSQAIEGYFIAAHARRLSAHTLRDYDITFHKFQQFLGQDPPLDTITAAQVRAFINSFDHLSAKTLLNYHTGLSALWTWAVKEGIVAHHIVRDVDPPRPDKREIVPFTEQEVDASETPRAKWMTIGIAQDELDSDDRRLLSRRDRAAVPGSWRR